MKITQLKYLQKNNIIFLRQDGKSEEYIHKYTKVPLYQINSILNKIYNSENHIFIVRSMSEVNKYFVFNEEDQEQKEMIVNDGLFIINKEDFDDCELIQISDLYGFRV